MLTTILNSPTTTTTTTSMLLLTYLFAELLFYLQYRLLWIPKANQRREMDGYRQPYHTNKLLLLERIMNRVMRDNGITVIDERAQAVLADFITGWLKKMPISDGMDVSQSHNSSGRMSVMTASTVSADDSSLSDSLSETSEDYNKPTTTTTKPSNSKNTGTWTIPGISKTIMFEFIGWAFFSKEAHELTPSEAEETYSLMNFLQKKLDFRYDTVDGYATQRLNIDPVRPIHRPLVVYGLTRVFYHLGEFLLVCLGFQKTSNTAVPALIRKSGSGTPLVFFHGIAPGGIFCYIPMLLSLGEDRPIVAFQNKAVAACHCDFEGIREAAFVRSVKSTLDHYGIQKFILAGHSFGSCPVSWLLHSSLRNRIAHALLIDPVTILLSESDVFNNFLYSENSSQKFRIVASSELFTEFYLRRHFSWYNADLWLDDFTDIPTTVALSELDEIVPSPKVQRHLQFTHASCIYWRGESHAACVVDPRKWRELKHSMYNVEFGG